MIQCRRVLLQTQFILRHSHHRHYRTIATMASTPNIISSTELSAADAKSVLTGVSMTSTAPLTILCEVRWITLKKIKYADADGKEVNICTSERHSISYTVFITWSVSGSVQNARRESPPALMVWLMCFWFKVFTSWKHSNSKRLLFLLSSAPRRTRFRFRRSSLNNIGRPLINLLLVC